MHVRFRVSFRGRVQGVGFRVTVQALAAQRALSGWVRNEPDGSVTLEAQGAADEVEGLLEDVRGVMPTNIEREDRAEIPPVEGEPSGVRITG